MVGLWLLLAVFSWLQQGCSVPVVRSEPKPLEDHSSVNLAHNLAASNAEVQEEWPDAPTAHDEVKLGLLKGGTRPEKVQIGHGVYVRKRVLEGQSQAIMMESLVNDLYEAARVKAERCRYYPGANSGTAYMLCRFIENLDPVRSFTEDVKKAVQEHFALDAVFGNYDVGGTNGDSHHRYGRGNVGWDSNKQLVRIDNGGSLAADGLGRWKPTTYACHERLNQRITTWSPEPYQLWDFRNPSFTEMYNGIAAKDIVAQLKAMMPMKEDILAAVDKFHDVEAKERVKATLKARIECAGRIADKRPELLEANTHASAFFNDIPKEVCDGVHALCRDLFQTAAK